MAAIKLKPVAAAVDSSSEIFYSYKSGIFDSEDCGTNLSHAVNIVGYGTDKDSGKVYYIVRNSWGTTWGEEGYIRIAAVDGDGICGI